MGIPPSFIWKCFRNSCYIDRNFHSFNDNFTNNCIHHLFESFTGIFSTFFFVIFFWNYFCRFFVNHSSISLEISLFGNFSDISVGDSKFPYWNFPRIFFVSNLLYKKYTKKLRPINFQTNFGGNCHWKQSEEIFEICSALETPSGIS